MTDSQELLPEEFSLLWRLAMDRRAGLWDTYQVTFEDGAAILRGTTRGQCLTAAPTDRDAYRWLHRMGYVTFMEPQDAPPLVSITEAGCTVVSSKSGPLAAPSRGR